MPTRRFFSRPAGLACSLLFVLVAVPVALTWREWQQAKRNNALITAVKEGNSKTAVLALREGADPNACDKSYRSLSLWQFLSSRFAPSRQPGRYAPSALEMAVSSPQTTADTIALVKALLESGANPNGRDREGKNLLFDALEPQSDRQVFILLVQHGAKINVQNDVGETPLMLVAGYDAELTRLLLDNGADIEAKNKGGGTALSHAINSVTLGNKDTIVRLLIARHANVNAVKDKQMGNYYLWMARRFNEPGITTLLKKAGATP